MTIKVLDELKRRLVDPEMLHELAAIGVSLVQKNVVQGNWTPNAPLTQAIKGNNLPLRDRGQLLASFSGSVQGSEAVIRTNHIAARILHDGGEIRPRSSRFLAIPAGADARAFMRSYGLTPRTCIEGMKAAGYRFFYRGPVLLAKKGKQGKVHALFIMKKSVTIPARPYMRLPPESIEILRRVVQRRLAV